jgi:hypothetical protein
MLTLITENPLAAMFIACEVGLWVLLGAGLVLRYVLGFRLLSTITLVGIPLLDLARVLAVAVDLHRGTPVGSVHVVAAFLLAFSVAFGPAIVRWADVRFAHRFAGGPAPRKVPKHGPERMAHLMREWYRVVGTAAIASVVLVVLILFFAAPQDQAGLWWWIGRAWAVVGLWYVVGPLWESGKSWLATQPDTQADGGVAHDPELLGDLNGGRAATGVAGVHRSGYGEYLADLRR